MTDPAARELLQRAADQAGDRFQQPTIEQFHLRRRNRRRRWAAAAACGAVVALVAALAVTLGRPRSAAPDTDQPARPHPPTVLGSVPAPPAGFSARDFRMAYPLIVPVVGGIALPRPTCTADQITASAATRTTVGGVLGVVHLIGQVVGHRHGGAVRCALPVSHGPAALLAADGQPLNVPLSPGDRTTPPGNPRPDLALDNGEAIWGFAWLGSFCGTRATAVEIPLHHRANGALRIPLQGPQPSCASSSGASVLIDGVPGWPGQPVQPPRPDYTRLRLHGHIRPGTTSSQLAPIDLTLHSTSAAPITLDPCPGYAAEDFAHAHSGGFGGLLSTGTLPCTNQQLMLKPGQVLHYTVPAANLGHSPDTRAIPGSTVQVNLGIAGLPVLHLKTTVH